MHETGELSDLLIEFYEKFSSWEQAVVRDSAITLPQMHTLAILGQQSPLRMKELAAKMGATPATSAWGTTSGTDTPQARPTWKSSPPPSPDRGDRCERE